MSFCGNGSDGKSDEGSDVVSDVGSDVCSDSLDPRYECQASNPFGKSFYHIHLQIWGNYLTTSNKTNTTNSSDLPSALPEPPSSPDNLTLASVTSRTARIAW